MGSVSFMFSRSVHGVERKGQKGGSCTSECVTTSLGGLLEEDQVKIDIVIGCPAEFLRRAILNQERGIIVPSDSHWARIDELIAHFKLRQGKRHVEQ